MYLKVQVNILEHGFDSPQWRITHISRLVLVALKTTECPGRARSGYGSISLEEAPTVFTV